MQEVVILMGYPASGKSTQAKSLVDMGHVRLNRDTEGGSLEGLLPKLKVLLKAGRSVVLDNTYVSVESRAGVVKVAKECGVVVRVLLMGTTIEEAQYNASMRMLAKEGKLYGVSDMPKGDPGLFPSTVLFAYRKQYQPPTVAEGFSKVEVVPFTRKPTGYTNKGIILDYDGTLRVSKKGDKYPLSKEDIEILPGRKEVLHRLQKQGYILCGASNQSVVSKGIVTSEQIADLFRHTNKLLGFPEDGIDVRFCPHAPAPITCFCRKPMPGMGVQLIEKHKLSPQHTIMVGDLKTDSTFAFRVGIKFAPAEEFFANPDKFLTS